MCRTLEGYCEIIFPHCQCDARKEGHVIMSVSLRHLSLLACSTDGVSEVSTLLINKVSVKEHNFTPFFPFGVGAFLMRQELLLNPKFSSVKNWEKVLN